MSQRYVKSARCTTPVNFNGPADATILAKHGVILWNPKTECLECFPDARPGTSMIVPMANVAFFLVMSAAEEEQYLAGRKAEADAKVAQAERARQAKLGLLPPPPPPAPKGPPANDDTIVMMKDPLTGAISERRKSDLVREAAQKAAAAKADLATQIEQASAADDE